MRLFAAIVVLLCAATVHGSGRVLHVFDFEERSLGNTEEVPMGWRRIVGPGYPHYVRGKLERSTAEAPAFAGDWSFHMKLDGGSVAYRLTPHTIPVTPGVRYRVEAALRTLGNRHAAATVEAYFADKAGRMIDGTRTTSDIHRGNWERRAVELVAPTDADGGSLVLQIGLYQPTELDAVEDYRDIGGDLGKALRLDVRGSAWVDDIVVTRVPTLVFDTPTPLQVFPPGERPSLRLAVVDERTDDLTATIAVTDLHGNEVFRRSGPMPTLAGDGPTLVALPPLPAGYYEARMLVSAAEHGQLLLRRRLSFVVCPDETDAMTARRGYGDARFGFDLTRLSADAIKHSKDVLPVFGVGSVVLPLWSETGFNDERDLSALLSELQILGIDASACLIKPPTAEDWSDAGGDERWHDPIGGIAARHATLMRRWQIGDIETAELWPEDAKRKHAYRRAQAILRPLLGSDRVSMPWPIWYEPMDIPGNEPALTLRVPTGVLPKQVPLYVDDLRRYSVPREVTLSLDPLASEPFGMPQQWRDLALRIGYAVSADADRVMLRMPMTKRDGIQQPTPLALPMRTIFRTLGHTTFVGEVPVSPLTRGFIYEDIDGTGVMMVWAEEHHEDVELDVAVGGAPVLVDMLGNRMPLEVIDGRVRFTATQVPSFIVGVDPNLAKLRLSTTLDNPLVEASFGEHQRTLSFTNPYKYHLTGTFSVTGPDGWEIEPLQRRFQLGPGETAQVPVRIRFPFNSPAGDQPTTVRFRFDSSDLEVLDVPIDLRLGLSDVSISSMAFLDRGTLVVQQVITNYGEGPINYNSFVVAPGYARQERLVIDLAPGSSTIKRYRFPSFVGPADLRSGLYEIDGDRVLNERLRVE